MRYIIIYALNGGEGVELAICCKLTNHNNCLETNRKTKNFAIDFRGLTYNQNLVYES